MNLAPLPILRSAALTLGLFAWTMSGCDTSRAVVKKSKDVQSVPVKTVVVQNQQMLRTTLQPATVHAYYRSEIRTKSTGFVKVLNADIGDYVRAGQPLAVIDVPEQMKQRQVIDARIRRLMAEENRASAGVQLAKAEVRAAIAKRSEAESQMASTEASLAAAEAEFRRTEDMVGRGSLQTRVLDEVRMKRDSEQASKQAMAAAVESAEAQVVVAQSKVASAEADLNAAVADTEIAQSELEEMNVLIDYAIVRAPFPGLITERNVEPGDLVGPEGHAPSEQPMFVISQTNKLRVRIAVPEAEAAWVQAGDPVTLMFPSFESESPVVAEVSRRSGNLDPQTRTMMVEVDLENPAGKWIPGMFGQASIQLESNVPANVLPAQAIRFDESGKPYVYLVNEGDTIEIRDVTTGIDTGNSIEVKSGLEVGQRVVGPHLKRFTDGQQVAVLDVPAR